jgi:hypothetical protein
VVGDIGTRFVLLEALVCNSEEVGRSNGGRDSILVMGTAVAYTNIGKHLERVPTCSTSPESRRGSVNSSSHLEMPRHFEFGRSIWLPRQPESLQVRGQF